MAAVRTNGYTNIEGVKGNMEEFSEEDGYFTCAVSVQHKKHDFETSSAYSASDSEHARKVVWPANQTKLEKQTVDTSKTFQNAFKQATGQVDQPHKWLQKSQTSDEHELEKKTDMRQAAHRMSRSSSRSKNIMDRARSFERAAAESRGNSRPASRTGSIASRHRSPSGTRGQVDEMWMNQLERPSSRTDVDSRRFGEIGKVHTADWEERIKGSMENLPTRTPPMKRKEINMKRNPDLERGLDTKTPEPPPPPTRMTYPPNTIKEPEAEFPPPPDSSDTKSKLSEESVGQISEENKENIVKQWVESTTQSAEDIAKELEKFAYDIAESVVSNMEKNSEKKESFGTHSQQSTAATSAFEQSQSLRVSDSQAGSGIYFPAPAASSRHELHGPVYVQEENRRVGMTFQQEERRREELRKQEEAKQEEKRRIELELEAQRVQEEQQRKLDEMKRAQEEEMKRKKEEEEAQRLELEKQQRQALKRQEEERIRQAEMERQAEEKMRLEEMKRAEEQRLKLLEMKKIEEEKKRQEILRFEKLKQEEELKRQEEMRLEQEMRRQFEMQQQLEIQRQKEQQLLVEQQKMLQEQKEKELHQAHIQKESIRDHIPKLSKTKSFEASQDRHSEINKSEDHLSLIKTGQVNEKRNFWMRSTSLDRVNQVSLSPAPRRRRIDWNVNRQKENEDPESRPGSSLGQAAQIGSVKNLSSGYIAKSKSTAAVMQDEIERGRPKQKTVIANGWTKEQYDAKVKQDFLKSQEVKTNKVNETIQTWGMRDSSATGRTTPAPSRNIGEVFSENRVAKTSETDKNANSWRTKTPEPTLKLVNVSVEKAMGSNQNIHISENAQKQMANFMTSSSVQQKEEMCSTVMTNTMSSESSVTSHSMSTMSRCSADNNAQPPPTPERNQSYGGKCENTIKPKTEPIRNEPKQTVSDATIDTVAQTSTEQRVTNTTANIEQSVLTVSSNKESVKTVCPLPVSRQDQIQQTVPNSHVLQNSTSTQSINSVLSTCSSSALPVPVKQGWFDEMEHLSTTSNSSYAIPEGVLSPTGTGKTPLPVIANWFDALEAKMTDTKIDKSSKPVRNEQAENKPNVATENENACPYKTTSLLNEILDELVIDESALELNESSEETGTMKRKQIDNTKSVISDDADSRSVQSDATVIEKKDNATPKEKEESLIVVPQSPREIRKKFQVASSFERSFTKSADVEFSKEFKEGIKGKVKESRDNFLRQATVDAKTKETNSKQEMEEIKLHRALSQNTIDQEESKADIIKQEKLKELEAVKRSRSKSRANDEESVQNSYLQEKRERELELLQLANRSTNMSWETENRELQLREERNKELAELVNRTVETELESEPAGKDQIQRDERNKELALLANRKVDCIDLIQEDKTTLLKEERRKELEEIANRKVEIEWENNNKEQLFKEERAKELLEISNRAIDADSEMEKSEQIWNERAEELKQIASMRSKSPWQQEPNDSPVKEKNLEFDSPEIKGKVRNTAAAWKEREKSASRDKEHKTDKDTTLKEIPTRRIGSLFKRDSDYWNLSEPTEDFPEPPSEAEIAQVSHNPPPPLRQSSKGKIEEYTRDPNWNAPWRKS